MPPRIAVLLDENFTHGGTHYELPKQLMDSLSQAGAYPFALPYDSRMVPLAAEEFDGFVSPGGIYVSPADWYEPGDPITAQKPKPPSLRYYVDALFMKAFLKAKKPVLGLCSGMQLLAALHGSKMSSCIVNRLSSNIEHKTDGTHGVCLTQDSLLQQIFKQASIEVNSRHREAVVQAGPGVRISALAPDGAIEAIEIPSHPFAIGVQWHDVMEQGKPAKPNLLIQAFVNACLPCR